MQDNFKETEIGFIPVDWDIKTVDNIKSKNHHSIAMGPFGSDITKDNFVSEGIPVIRGVNLGEFKFNEDKFVYLTKEKANKLKASNAFPKDIVITHRGTLGQVGIIPENSKYSRYVVSQSQMKLTCNEEIMNPYFMFYFLKSKLGQYLLLMNTSQTGVPAIARPTSSLKEIKVMVPPISEQNSIVNFLKSLDSKIELNQHMNQTLEEIGRAIFKHWFVDFEFPDEQGRPYKSSGGEMVDSELGKIPTGWELKPLDKIANFLNGLALQKYPPMRGGQFLPVIKIRELKQGITQSTDKASHEIPQEYIINDGDVLFSWSGSLELVLWCGGLGALNQHLFKVTSDNFPKWFYFYQINENLPRFREIAAGKATTMGHIQRHHLSETLVAVPPLKLMKRADELIGPLIDSVINKNIQSHNLSSIRDSLLPKLMSGKIRVKGDE